jgi:uncharacterized protein (DUF1800 family)
MADRQLVAHLLRRATFGPTAAEVDAAEAVGYDATLAALITPVGRDAGAAATPVPALESDAYAGLGKDASREEKQRARQARRQQVVAAEQWWLSRMVAAQHQLTEKVVFFWHGHWATSVQKVKSAPLMLRQLETFRRSGRGDFAVLVKAMLRDPALIVWLDGQRNTRRAPNENLGRELMELFTLGVGGYTEDDVKAGARALTGWTVDRAGGAASLVMKRHDSGPKTILGVTATFDVDSFADLLVAQPIHGTFLAQRLWFRFASGSPLEPATRDRLTMAYRAGRDVNALLRALFTEEAFARTRGQLVKQPVEWLIGAIRQLELTPAQLGANKRRGLLSGLDNLGQVPLRPPSVAGWPAGAAWLNTSSLQVRLRLAAALAAQAGPEVLRVLSRGTDAAKMAELARLLSVDAWTDRTRSSLLTAAGQPRTLLAAGLTSPENTTF